VGSPGVVKVDRARLAELAREQPDATLAELRDRLGVKCAISTICMALNKLGLIRIPLDNRAPVRHLYGYAIRAS